MHFIKTVFRGQYEGFRQVIAGDHRAFLFCIVQKFHSFFGIGGIVQIKDADDGRIPHRHIITDRKIHPIPPSHKSNLPPIWKDFPQYNSKFLNNPALRE